MKKLIDISVLLLLTSCMSGDPVEISVSVNVEQNAPTKTGDAYFDSYQAAIQANKLAGKYRKGDPEWEEKNDEWVNGESEDPYPDDLKDIDGCGYEDSQRAAEDAGYLTCNFPDRDSFPGIGYEDSVTAAQDADCHND